MEQAYFYQQSIINSCLNLHNFYHILFAQKVGSNQTMMRSSIKTDISQNNQSKLRIPLSQYLELKQQIKKVKYPTYAFSQAQSLAQKINSFKNQKVRAKLQEDLGQLNSYRKVRGDGNCFFRALAFCYIASKSIPSFKNCFQMINQINLACCFPESIPKDFQRFYDNKLLLNILQNNWQPTYRKCLKESSDMQKKALLKLFDENPYLDFIIVLYFRAICLKALFKYHQMFTNFITGDEETSIRTYSEETQGISINLCSKILNITIFVYEVRKDQIHSYHYDASKIERDPPKIYLLFNQSHYDIIEQNDNIQAEKSALKRKQTYYSQINQKMKPNGTCVECNAKTYIYEVSGLCARCHECSLTSLNDFQKQSFIRARCNQCQVVRDDVSQSFGLCRRCIQIQNEVQMQRKNDSLKRRCSICNRLSILDAQTGLCEYCLNSQKQLQTKMQQTKKKQQLQIQARDPQIPSVVQSQIGGTGERPDIKNEQYAKSMIQGSEGYYGYTCKRCKQMKLKGLINGLCTDCSHP